MIEFKAECGHTVRAKDENAGGVVRCSYCGKEAGVPDTSESELDFLFRDVEQASEPKAKRRRRRPRSLGGAAVRTAGKPIDPFAVILKLCYAAVLISIIIVVGKKFVIPLFAEGGLAQRTNITKGDEPKKRVRVSRRGGRSVDTGGSRFGLIVREGLKGLYLSSTPPGGTAYFVKAKDAPPSGRIDQVRGCSSVHLMATTLGQRATDGTYVVEVVFALNAPSLKSYPNYRAFRRDVEEASEQDRTKVVNKYFLPDGASDVFVNHTGRQLFLVRQYRDIEVRGGSSMGVRALFLPKIMNPDKRGYAVEQLLHSYMPADKAYSFDVAYVEDELDFRGVSPQDRPFVIELLLRTGAIPYRTPDKTVRLFEIGLNDGAFSATVISN